MENLVVAIVIAALVLAERHPRLRFERLAFVRRHFGTDALCLLTGVFALGIGMRSLAGAHAGVLLGGVFPPAEWPAAVVGAAAIVLYDLGGWTCHLLLHRFDVLWELHKVHHSSLSLDWLATFRAHLLEHALRHLLSPVLLLLTGFPLEAVAFAGVVYASAAAFNHSNLAPRLRLLEPLLVTPRLHRLHHVPSTSERNFGTVFSVWDRLLGTLVTDPAAHLSPIGVPGEVARYPQDWPRLFVEPLRRIASRRRSPSVAELS